MKDEFWSQHLSLSEAARRLGVSRQNIHQRVGRGSVPSAVDATGARGVPLSFIEDELSKRGGDE